MMMRTKSLLLVVLALAFGATTLSLAGCNATAKPRVKATGLATAPFGSYRTFSFSDEASPTPDASRPGPNAVEVRARLEPLLAEELQRKGYVRAQGKGDMVVQFVTGRRTREIKSAPVVRGDTNTDSDDGDTFVEGAVVIDVFDGSNDGHVWHGTSRQEIDPKKVNPELLRKIAQDMLEKFPNAAPTTTTTAAPTPPQ